MSSAQYARGYYVAHAAVIKSERQYRYATDPVFRHRLEANRAARRAFPEQRPCEVCNHPRADRHHDDYSKPLEIRWLCRSCHTTHHRRNPA